MKKLFTSKDISLQLKLRLVRCYIFSVFFYGVEAWTTTEATLKERSWTEQIINMEVMQRLGKEKEVAFTVKKRKLEYFGQIPSSTVGCPGQGGWIAGEDQGGDDILGCTTYVSGLDCHLLTCLEAQ